MKTSWIFQPCLMTEMYYDRWPMAWVWGTTTGRARLCFDPPRRKAPGVDRRWPKCCWVWSNMRNYSNSRPEIHRITILETLCSIFRGWTMHQHRKKVNWSTNVGCDGIGNLGVQETKKTKKDKLLMQNMYGSDEPGILLFFGRSGKWQPRQLFC